MNSEELKTLKPGTHLRSRATGELYMVTGNYGERATAVATVDITQPVEWEIAAWTTQAMPGHTHLTANTPDEKLLLRLIKTQWSVYAQLLEDWDHLMESKAYAKAEEAAQ